MSNFFVDPYNAEEKEWFLSEIGIERYPERWWERLFEKSRLLEDKYQKDLYGFTAVQIQELYKLLNLNLESLIVLNTNLIKYGNWALTNNLLIDGQNHFTEFNTELLNRCVSKAALQQSVVSLDEFRLLIRDFDNYQDKFIYYCLFEGIKGKQFSDVINLKLEDIDQRQKTVKLFSGRTIEVSQDFIDISIEANKETLYYSFRPLKLIPSEYIYKSKENVTKDQRGRNIQRTFVRMVESKRINANAIFQSGLIHYLNKRAKERGVHVKDMIYDLDMCGDIIDKYCLNKDTRGRFLIKYEDFLV